MRLSFLAVGVLVSAIGTVSLALGIPSQTGKASRFKLSQSLVAGGFCDSAGNCSTFNASILDDPSTGGAQGFVLFQTYTQSGTLLTYIRCEGLAYANVLSDVNMGTGTAKVNATINPASSDCTSFNASTMTFSLTATKDGSYHSANTGSGQSESPDSAFKFKDFAEEYAVKFTGLITGYSSADFSGTLYDFRHKDVIRIR